MKYFEFIAPWHKIQVNLIFYTWFVVSLHIIYQKIKQL